jgi:myo-inositol-1(or 4)-monophosphatase
MASFLETSVEIAREAGALVAQHFARHIPYELKGESDLVTAADRASERLVVERLRAHFPTHAIVAEEGGSVEGTSEYRWYVDPLDGTTNFAHGLPHYNVTLGLERAGEMIAGVIYDPARNEMFAAERGGGAFLNNHRIHASGARRVTESLLSTGFPNRNRPANINVHFYYQLSLASHGIRRAGSAALDAAWVACGRLEAYWEFGLKPWDMAAGVIMVQEAGGRVSDMHGGPVKIGGAHVVMDNGHIHDELLGWFSDIFAGKYKMPIPEIGT